MMKFDVIAVECSAQPPKPRSEWIPDVRVRPIKLPRGVRKTQRGRDFMANKKVWFITGAGRGIENETSH